MFALQPEPEAGKRWRSLLLGAALAGAFASLVLRAGSLVQVRLPRAEPPKTTLVFRAPAPAIERTVPQELTPKAEPKPVPKAQVQPAAAQNANQQPAPQEPAAPPAVDAAPPAPVLLGVTFSNASASGAVKLAGSAPAAAGPRPQGAGSGTRASAESQSSGASGDSARNKQRVDAKVVRAVTPHYPVQAKREGIQGVVVLAVTIDDRGRVEAVTVLSGLGHGLDESAVQAVRQSTWLPATLGERPVRTTRRFNVRFALQN